MDDAVTVMLVGLDAAMAAELADDERFDVRSADDLDQVSADDSLDAVVVAMNGQGPLELLGSVRGKAPRAAVVVVTEAGQEADGAVAMHAGAEDHLVLGSIPVGLLPRAVSYAASIRRLRRELATTDEVTGLPNLRGFVPIAEHHLRMADRSRAPVVFLFVRIDGEVTDADAREAAEVLLDAVRDADLPARITDDTFSVLLTGEATGAETLVLSRLVEAIAVHNAKQDPPRPLSLSVGSALYEPETPTTLSQILETAGRRLHDRAED
ncbi:MAG: diguanylate cyclase [Actinomycetota bacterium]|nr:diguanylate cyclase [Actinomycetota bacterium]MDH5224803.1 diguanylate cyclase [Actinomycetota bacterium]MDH5313372.1 diguanylate cyclase [Actinomycetota bacterium]